MSLHRIFCLVLLSGVLLMAAANAADGTFQTRVPVPDQSTQVRTQALHQAIVAAVLRLTGSEEALAQPAVAELLEQPERYLQRYRYEQDPSGELLLTAAFDGASLRRALVERGVPVWSDDRPPVLVWLGFERGVERGLVGADEAADLRDGLIEAAQARGISLLFPLLDGEDRQKVAFSDVWGGFEEPIRAASQRYGTPAVLIGRLYRDGSGQWIGRWRLADGGVTSVWEVVGGDQQDALDRSVIELSRRLAAVYRGIPSERLQGGLQVRISGVGNLQAYLELNRRLAGVSGVDHVRPVALEGDQVVFQLGTSAAPQRLRRALEADGRLQAMPTSTGDDSYDSPEYEYRFIP